jgi:hypothetical protein
MNIRCTRPRRVKAEPSEKAETVQHLRARQHRHELRHALIIHLLVEVEAGLVAGEQVGLELKAVQLHNDFSLQRSHQHSAGIRQAFKLARSHFVPLQDGAGREEALQRGDDVRLAPVHAQRGRLHHQHVLVFVHDQPAQQVALGIDHAEGTRLRQAPPPDRERRANSFLEERLVHLDALRRDHADVDLRLGIVEADPQQPLAMVLHLHDVAVGSRLGEADDGAVVNPGMPGQHTVGLTGFQ